MRDFVVDNDLTASDPKEVEIYADKRLLKRERKKKFIFLLSDGLYIQESLDVGLLDGMDHCHLICGSHGSCLV